MFKFKMLFQLLKPNSVHLSWTQLSRATKKEHCNLSSIFFVYKFHKICHQHCEVSERFQVAEVHVVLCFTSWLLSVN